MSGPALCGLSALGLIPALSGASDSLPAIMAGLGVYGIGLGVYIASNNNETMAAAPVEKSATAGGLLNLLRIFGGAVGVAASAAVLAWCCSNFRTDPLMTPKRQARRACRRRGQEAETMNLVRLKNNQFADEANINNVSYRIYPDGLFYTPPDVAEQLCNDGRSGFVRAPDHRAAPGTVSEEQIISMIAGLEPGRLKQALSAALLSLQLKVTPIAA